jgi:hypothetical protein
MSIEKERLLSLIEFAQQPARMNKKAVARIEQRGLFRLYEHEQAFMIVRTAAKEPT